MQKDYTRYVKKGGVCEGHNMSAEGIWKGYIFCQNGLDLRVEPLRIELCRIPPLPPSLGKEVVSLYPTGVLLTYRMGLTKLECKGVKMCYKYITNF